MAHLSSHNTKNKTHSNIYKRITSSQRVVIKIGTNAIMHKGNPDTLLLEKIIFQIKSLIEKGKEVLLISSGAIGFGATKINIQYPINTISLRQACAAVGQPYLMAEYGKACIKYNMQCAQILLTKNDLKNTTSLTFMKDCITTLFKKKCLPIINENDSVATDEINMLFGDNDRLSAMIAVQLHADILIILTDVDAFYTKNPLKHKDASPIKIVDTITPYLNNTRKESGSSVGTGGMYTKLIAAQMLKKTKCIMIISNAEKKNILLDIIEGKSCGTIFVP